DEGKPVDEIIYSNSCFSIFNKTKITHDATGCYDGLYGSTYLAREKVGKPVKYKAGAFELKSASSYFTGLKAEIYVQVTDVEITELVLANEDCPYGQPLGASREGTYFIKQWVDFSEWHQRVNGDKVTLEEVKGAHITGSDPIIDTTADWLERRAAEVLNTTFPEVVPYVVRIFLEGDPNKSGLAKTRRKEIYINPAMKSNRYNLGSCMYAFCNRAALDGIARHEAYHCFYFWTVDKLMDNSFKYRDDDPSPANDIPKGDGLPDETGGPVSGATGNKFEYTLDVGDNRYGGFGPIGRHGSATMLYWL
ncbi:MAG: hypothetical protein NT033_05490, partial [Candidatus Omnitrophica bacterium]|nr:hypothetical protein [Candidatus Omnitrophota bacterium]